MGSDQYTVKAAPINGNVAFVTRTGDDAPNASKRGQFVPGYSPQKEVLTLDQPCTLKGLSGGLAAGLMGYVFGFLPGILRHPNLQSLSLWHSEGLASAQGFAVMSGIYATAQCVCERLRQKDDGINRIVAGAASGVAMAWGSGLVGALQSGVLLAVVSWVFDYGLGGGGSGAAKAACVGGGRGGCASGACSVNLGRVVSCSYGTPAAEEQQEQHQQRQGRRSKGVHLQFGGAMRGLPDPMQVLRTPVVVWMGPIVNRAYFSPQSLSLQA
ncbi:hypothetical protein Agub_g46 [Astrephomene gubernaculifera]|uniref:Mitochondrial import inner membrane translocase subunit TIM22 n=1 Tax=Astrephomene gubernaculifera TaxID=47775 RepID=A0AAD3DGI4_9CHLO|nr:hypothetical protein Agub_g46 [Astrephomene gubernaculifera]